LFLIDGLDPPWLDSVSRANLRNYIAHHDLASLGPRLVTRAERRQYHIHRSFLKPIQDEPGLMRTGGSVAYDVGALLIPGDEFDAYLTPERLDFSSTDTSWGKAWNPTSRFGQLPCSRPTGRSVRWRRRRWSPSISLTTLSRGPKRQRNACSFGMSVDRSFCPRCPSHKDQGGREDVVIRRPIRRRPAGVR
jgi:hypothetical protein